MDEVTAGGEHAGVPPERRAYKAPAVEVIGTVVSLTQGHKGHPFIDDGSGHSK